MAPSYVCGLSSEPLLYRTVGGVLEDAVRQWPENLALVVRHQGIRWTYREFAARVEEVARGLLAFGLQAGDRVVGIWSPNCAEWNPDAIRHSARGTHSGQHQPGLSGSPSSNTRCAKSVVALCCLLRRSRAPTTSTWFAR